MKNLILMCFLHFVVFAMSGCNNAPNDKDITSQIKAAVQEDMEEVYKVVSIKKTNGVMVNDKEYSADVAITIEYIVSLEELALQAQKEAGSDLEIAFEAALILSGLEEAFGNFKKGEQKTDKQKFAFSKTESGWKLSTE